MRKNYFDPFLAVKYVTVTWLWSNYNPVRGAAYLMCIPNFKLISQNMYKTSPENISLAGSCTNSRFRVYCPQEGQ